MMQKENQKNFYKEYQDKSLFCNCIIAILNYLTPLFQNYNWDNKNEECLKLKNFSLELIRDFEEIKKNNELKEENIYKYFKYFYFNRNIFNVILYETQETINVDFGIKKSFRLAFYFYLSLLIRHCLSLNDYTYSINLIREANKLQKIRNKNIYIKIILSKIIIELIEYYKNLDDYYPEKEEKELNQIKEENDNIIKENNNYIKQIGLDLTKSIDEIYIKIIIFLIYPNNSKNYNEIYNIIDEEELDLQNIIITNKMLEELSLFLKSNEKFILIYIK